MLRETSSIIVYSYKYEAILEFYHTSVNALRVIDCIFLLDLFLILIFTSRCVFGKCCGDAGNE